MFRRLYSSLPEDPVFPADLDELGYFINDRDQIRYKNRPELEFVFHINKNERVNEMQREAMNKCIRNLLQPRLENLGLTSLRLPFAALPSEPYLPILVSPDLDKKSRIIVFFGEPCQDLGILAYRVIGTSSIHKGSIEEFVQGILDGKANGFTDKESPGIVIANPGQLVWHRGGAKALTLTSWTCLPRKTAVHDSMRIDPTRNRIVGNENLDQHVMYIFETVLGSVASKRIQIDVIALEWCTLSVIRYLNSNWSKLSSSISTVITGAPQYAVTDIHNADNKPTTFTDFMSKRARAYLMSPAELGSSIAGRDIYGCNCYSAGENVYSELVMVAAWRSMFSWLAMVHSVPGYAEVEIQIDADPMPALMDSDGEKVEEVNGVKED